MATRRMLARLTRFAIQDVRTDRDEPSWPPIRQALPGKGRYPYLKGHQILVVVEPAEWRTKMSNPVCAVIDVGPGNGTAIARKFSSEGYKIALLSRNEDYLNELAHELGDTRGYAYDALDTAAPEKVFGKIKQELGTVDVLVYNAGSGMFGSVDESSSPISKAPGGSMRSGCWQPSKRCYRLCGPPGKATLSSSVQPHPLNTGQTLPLLPQPRPRNVPLPSRLRSMWGPRACTSLW